MNHSFNVEDAKNYGVECAIILENIRFWIEKNKANERHFYDGQYWTYNSVRAFSVLFPYWSEHQIRRYLEKLEDLGIIKSGNYNESPYNKAKWYCLIEQIDLANLPNHNGEIAKSITDINTDIKPVIKNNLVVGEIVERLDTNFDLFWMKYPRRENKASALKAWKKHKPDIYQVLNALSWQVNTEQWQKGFIPHASTYINQHRWLDEMPREAVPF